MINVASLCMGCMEVKPGDPVVCPTCGYRAGTDPDSALHLRPRTELHGQYVIGRVLGHGGFGITYLGWDINLERKVAIKEYLPSGVAVRTGSNSDVMPFSGDMRKDFEYGLERYLDEARVVAKFQTHPSVVTVLNFFRDNGTAYLVMEYLEGTTFERYLEKQGGKTSMDTVLTVMVPVMEALSSVHSSGILHRDISPDNIYITRKWQVKVLDFGAARYALGQKSRNLSVILKEGYAPVEQYQSKGNQGPWTDAYACAATIYRALTGRVPPSALDRMQTDEMEPPSQLGAEISPAQEQAILQAMSVAPANRFQTMVAFRNALTGVSLIAAPPAPAQPLTTSQTGPSTIASGPFSQANVATIRSGAATPIETGPGGRPEPQRSVFGPVQPPSGERTPSGERIASFSRKPPKATLPKWVWAGLAGLLLLIFGIAGYSQYAERKRIQEQQQKQQIEQARLAEEMRKQKVAEEADKKRQEENALRLAELKEKEDEILRKQKELEEQNAAIERARQQGTKQQTQNNQNQQQQQQQQKNQQQQKGSPAELAYQQQLRDEAARNAALQQQLQQQQELIRRQQLQQQQQQEQQQNQGNQGVQGNADANALTVLVNQSARAMSARNFPTAMQFAQQAIKQNPARPEGYSQAGWVSLYGMGDTQAASNFYKDALSRGGVAWFRVNHDHGNGSFQQRCVGSLGVANDHVEFRSENAASHNFRMRSVSIAEASRNSTLRMLAGVTGDFHIKSSDGRNFNLQPITHSKQVRDIILSLIGGK